MRRKSFVGMIMAAVMVAFVGLAGASTTAMVLSADLMPVIYLYPQKEAAVTVTLDYNGTLTTKTPEFNIENGWSVVAYPDGKIALGEDTYDYLLWEGNPDNRYNFFSGFCVKGADTEKFLKEKLKYLGLNDTESKAFIDYWLPQMKDNTYNVISFQEGAYTNNARLNVTPEPDSTIRVFMAWYPSEKEVKILPQYIDGASRSGFAVVEWGGNKVK